MWTFDSSKSQHEEILLLEHWHQWKKYEEKRIKKLINLCVTICFIKIRKYKSWSIDIKDKKKWRTKNEKLNKIEGKKSDIERKKKRGIRVVNCDVKLCHFIFLIYRLLYSVIWYNNNYFFNILKKQLFYVGYSFTKLFCHESILMSINYFNSH